MSPSKKDEFLTQFLQESWQSPQDGHMCNLGPLPFLPEPLATHCGASCTGLKNRHFIFFFQLLPLGVAAAGPLPPSHSVPLSSRVTPTIFMSTLTISMDLIYGLTLFFLPSSSIINVLCPSYPLSLLCTHPNHLDPASLTLSLNGSTLAVPFDMPFLILSILVTPKHLSIFNFNYY